MKILLNLSIFLSTFFLSGCATDIKSLSPIEKKQLYHSVLQEVQGEIKKADRLIYDNYLNLALKFYKQAIFYETGEKCLAHKISSLEELITIKRKFFYKRARENLRKNPKEALMDFNLLMRVDPHYKDVQTLFLQTKNIPSNIAFLQNKEAKVQAYFIHGELNFEEQLSHVIIDLNKLLAYDDRNEIGLKYQGILREKKEKYLIKLEKKATTKYENDAITKAKEEFIFLLTVDPCNINAKKYITIIDEEKKMVEYVQESKRKLKEKKYREAKIYVNRALKIDPEYTKAKELLKQINAIATKEIPIHIYKGKKLYKEKRFKLALKEFLQVLEFQADNNTSKIFVKKINNRLKTIDALTH